MKKKLKIEQLKVQSFVTSTDASNLKGGGTLFECPAPNTPQGTEFSCYQYISCNPLACVIHSREDKCIINSIVVQATVNGVC